MSAAVLVINGKKNCCRCLLKREVSEFTVDRKMVSGLRAYCRECGASDWQKRYHADKSIFKAERDRSRTKLKCEVLSHYGNGQAVYVVCGENRIDCLSIDHIKGNGMAHRRSINRYGSSFHYWLKSEGYPEGYQTLCMNCQFIKRAENNENRKMI